MRKDEEVLTKKLLFNGIFIFSECGGLMISVCRRTEATWKKATDSKFDWGIPNPYPYKNVSL